MQDPVVALEDDQPFFFTCSPQVPCFNACCRNLNQVLTPYDVLCLAHHLRMTSGAFLSAYTETNIGVGSGLPVVSLRFADANDLACPFVSPEGCRVYPARPASCRTYPLARGVSRNRQTGKLNEHWALIQEAHCMGFACGRRRTVDQWVNDQALSIHNRMNDMMLDLIGAKNRFRPGPLKPDEQKQVFTALYDLDAFRRIVPAGSGQQENAPSERSPARTHAEMVELLIDAMNFVCRHVFSVRA